MSAGAMRSLISPIPDGKIFFWSTGMCIRKWIRCFGNLLSGAQAMFLNQRDGTFKNISKSVGPAIQMPQVSRGMAIGDLFNDGRMEAVVENLEGGPMILRPESGPRNHWISFQLEGVTCNRLALNARVRITAGKLTQLGEVNSSGSYLSQNDLRIHFGLDNHKTVDSVKIFWPDGRVETLTHLAADRFYSVREAAGVIASRAPEPYVRRGVHE